MRESTAIGLEMKIHIGRVVNALADPVLRRTIDMKDITPDARWSGEFVHKSMRIKGIEYETNQKLVTPSPYTDAVRL